MSKLAREQYVEREFKIWEEKFEIDFMQEYDVKLLLGLRHQLENTSDEKIKTKMDLIHTIQRVQSGLNLKPKYNPSQQLDVLFIVDHVGIVKEVTDFLKNILGNNIIKILENETNCEIVTKPYNIKIKSSNSSSIRGSRADILFNMSDDRELSKRISSRPYYY